MHLENVIFVFVNGPLGLFGFISQIVNVFVLNRLKEASNIFYYLKFESVFILFDCLIAILLILSKCEDCFAFISPIFICILDFVGYNFISDVCEYSSLTMEIVASLACFFMFSSTGNIPCPFNYILKAKSYFIAIGVLIISILITGYEFTMFQIEHNNVTNELECLRSEFQDTISFKLLSSIAFGFYYGFMMLILVIVNVLIAIKIRRNSAAATAITKNSTAKRKSSEKRLTLLVLFDCCNLMIGRLPMIIYFFLSTFEIIEPYFGSFTIMSILISYNFKFFIFFKFNSRFRNEVKRILTRFCR